MAPSDSPKSTKSSRPSSLALYLASFPGKCSATRYKSLYSEFDKLKETNPFGYEANINWWQTAILGAARNGLLSAYKAHDDSSFYVTSSYAHDAGPADSGGRGGGGTVRAKPRYQPTGAAIGILELELEHLATKFYRTQENRPQSLPTVLSEMVKRGVVVPRSEFMPWAGVGWSGWIFHKVVKAPLLWSLKQLSLSDSNTPPPGYSASPTLSSTGLSSSGGGSVSNGNLGIGGIGASSGVVNTGLGLGLTPSSSPSTGYRDTYVIVSFVQEAAARIHTLQQESVNYPASDNLMTFADFRQKFSRTALLPLRTRNSVSGDGVLGGAGPVIALTDRDLEILIRYMQYELKVLVTGKVDDSKQTNEVQDHELVIKFANKETIRNRTKQEITTADRGIIELRETIKRLDGQVQDIEERIAELTEKARTCLQKNQRAQAQFTLRQRKHLDDVLSKRLKSIDTISSIFFRIQSSETDAELLQSYKLGANTLASVMATKDENGQEIMSKENVEVTMDRISDVLADQQEVDQAMSDGASLVMETIHPGDEDDDIMAELEAMAQAESSSTPSTAKSTTPSNKHIIPERPLMIKKTTPPLPTDPFVSSSYGSTPATPGKRVAEIPVQSFVKQRKVSQANIHAPRLSSDGIEADEISSSLGSPQESSEQPYPMATDSSPVVQSTTPMETDRAPSESMEQKVKDHSEQSHSAEGASLATISSDDKIMAELQDIIAPTNDISTLIESEAEDTEEEEEKEKKTRKETRMMEHS
ncbi:MAG: Snf7-domain-containing protein [Linnemannia gamsii]|nr:MAG: Snf7-domain-containing protein [Linnemannia gamsii]